jgi:SAM-dependent methyltransferase
MKATSPPAPLAHGQEAPSAWVQRWSHLIPTQGTVLDLACGHGRHMKWFASRGHPVTGVDRSPEAIAAASTWGEALVADIENGPWPLMQAGQIRQFDAVVVTNYLWRALFPRILQSLAPGGVLIYETFAIGNETVGKPSRPDFLLQAGELLRAFVDLRVVAYEDGFMTQPERFVQRIAAVRSAGAPPDRPARYELSGLTR